MGWGGRFRLYYVLITVLDLIKRGTDMALDNPANIQLFK